ncbi:MAG: hypothetical protein JHC26_01915 [Thermofilum sp.]|jgi:hypothetical protein|uniref:hypothetical protein n=1 Tax=Thermofilum sp. TaxID=1961369 RepID=UPI00258E9E60|nr:hypothetical protein [Thermofilum sp.]MCI4407819.1 hypothetical protein [Thermofilum sp.]
METNMSNIEKKNEQAQTSIESKLVLTIEIWRRQGSSYDDYNDFRVIKGEIREIVLETWDSGYPYEVGEKVAIIPLSIPTIVEEEGFADNTSPSHASKFIHVFTAEGWKTIRVY